MYGIYVCYNEKVTGNFEEAIEKANREYLIWRHPAPIRRKLKYPTKIIIKISGEDRYYKGDLLLVSGYGVFNAKIFYEDLDHRPAIWKSAPEKDWKSVLIISNLQQVLDPVEVYRMHPPQGVRYIEFKNL